MLTLGIESTCDETAAAVVENGKIILSNVATTQIDLHSLYGGVVPELACRRHIDAMLPVIKEAMDRAGVTEKGIDRIAIAQGPGLVGALLLGIMTAQSLALAWRKPLVAVNHVQAHLYAAFMSLEKAPRFPSLGVILSGGHTALLLIKQLGSFELISQTRDDALGEAFDKVAKILDLPYPGGPEIEKLATEGDPLSYPFKAGQVKNDPLCFSFSGIKTGVLYATRGQDGKEPLSLTRQEKANIAASFQHQVFQDVLKKGVLAAEKYNCHSISFGGGVTNSRTLRALFLKEVSGLELYFPAPGLSLDNAAMIAGLGHHLPPESSPLELKPLFYAF